jgi:hypothetical protein
MDTRFLLHLETNLLIFCIPCTEIEEAGTEEFYQITINLPNKGGKVQVIVGAMLLFN